MRRRHPARRLPTPDELANAPELAILTSIEAVVDIAIVALVAAQRELQQTEDQHDAVFTEAAEAADRVSASAQLLAAAIDDYRRTLGTRTHPSGTSF